ncbi:M20 metallopeptidase family protein [Candidatus Hodarchaeum mangrovi]
MPNLVLEKCKELSEQIIQWRRNIHSNPELGFQETETANLIVSVLTQLGLEVQTKIGRTGVTATFGNGKPCIALRADMDALPLVDGKKVSYASQNPGISHACGHDAHVAMLLGTATILKGFDKYFKTGTVKYIFQPFEEGQDDDGVGGADAMMKDGVLEGVDAIISQHVHSELKAGTFQIKPGYFSAAVDTFYAKIYGKGAHGAYPHNSVDPTFITAQVINTIQGIISRRIDPLEPAVISIGEISGGTAPNIIPEVIALSGTIRSLSSKVRKQLHEDLESAFQISQAFKGNYELKIIQGYPSINNDLDLVKLLQEVAKNIFPPEDILLGGLGMGAEDFAVYSESIPGAMFYLGTALTPPRVHHSPNFDIDDSVLYLGTAIMAETVLRYLNIQI